SVTVTTGGTLALTGASAFTSTSGTNTFQISGGTVTNAGAFSFTGLGGATVFAFNGGTLGGAGTTQIGGRGSMQVNRGARTSPIRTEDSPAGTPGGGHTNATWNLGTAGTLAFGGAHDFKGTETFTGSGTMNVQSGGTFTVDTPISVANLINMTNAGTINFGTS